MRYSGIYWHFLSPMIKSSIAKNFGKDYAASTTTSTGLKIKCGVDSSKYETGIKVSDTEIENLNIIRNSFHGEWNYVISPH